MIDRSNVVTKGDNTDMVIILLLFLFVSGMNETIDVFVCHQPLTLF